MIISNYRIWEKKYGKNANHKQKEMVNRDAHIAQRRFQTRDKGIPRKSEQPPAGRRHEQPERSAIEKPLHPSWEAKRKLKERESARIVASQGQKITF